MLSIIISFFALIIAQDCPNTYEILPTFGERIELSHSQRCHNITTINGSIFSIDITLDITKNDWRICYDNYVEIYSNGKSLLKGICSKGLLRKSTYSCENNLIVKFNNPNFNSFAVKISAVNDTGSFVKPRECKIGTTQHTSQLIPSSVRCSTIRNRSTTEPRIIGGTDVESNNHPWLVRVARKTCGGTIIGWNHVITAAHCCSSKEIDVVIGYGNTELPPVIATRKLIHPNYNANTLTHDICILEFNQSLLLDKNANPACLPHKDDRPIYGTECFIAGYGYTVYDKSRSVPTRLQETSVPLMDYVTCAEWFHLENQSPNLEAKDYIRNTYYDEDQIHNYRLEDFRDEDIICAGNAYGNADACQGDSGGPLICVQEGKPVLQGVVSWGVRCGEALLPGVYTRVASHYSWINFHTNITNGVVMTEVPRDRGSSSRSISNLTLPSLIVFWIAKIIIF